MHEFLARLMAWPLKVDVSVEIVDDDQRTEGASVPQTVEHKAQNPGLVGMLWLNELDLSESWFLYSSEVRIYLYVQTERERESLYVQL